MFWRFFSLSWLALSLWMVHGSVWADNVYTAHQTDPVVALLTDFGWQDSSVGQMKGTLLSVNPAVRVVDISHSVAAFNLLQGAFMLDQSAARFPGGTIFIAVVYPHIRNDHPPILIHTKQDKYYIGPDDGILTVVAAREVVDKVWTLHDVENADKNTGSEPMTATGQDLFATVAGSLSAGISPDRLGDEASAHLVALPDREPVLIGSTITVVVTSIDHLGNISLNLSSDNDIASKLKVETIIKLSAKTENFSGPLVSNISDIAKDRLGLMYGPNKILQIIKKQGSAARDLNVVPGDTLILRL